jgi:hypothetical protein
LGGDSRIRSSEAHGGATDAPAIYHLLIGEHYFAVPDDEANHPSLNRCVKFVGARGCQCDSCPNPTDINEKLARLKQRRDILKMASPLPRLPPRFDPGARRRLEKGDDQ